MADLNSMPETTADALDTVEHLLRHYVPKNTSDAQYALAAINVLRRALGVKAPDHG